MAWKIILGFAILILIAWVWVRVAPLPKARLTQMPGPVEPGAHPMMGGIKVVRPLTSLPENAFARMLDVAEASPRTQRVGTGDDPAAFVTRSRLWGFPDIATIWVADGNLHVHSHLVFGRGDMGVNAAKVTRWFDKLERPEG